MMNSTHHLPLNCYPRLRNALPTIAAAALVITTLTALASAANASSCQRELVDTNPATILACPSAPPEQPPAPLDELNLKNPQS